MNPAESRAELDQSTLRFTVASTESLREGDTLIIRRISASPTGASIEAVPEKAVRAAAAKLLS
jgi:hypothetical protein